MTVPSDRLAEELRHQVYLELRRSGFTRRRGLIVSSETLSKEQIRARHAAQRRALLASNFVFLTKWQSKVIKEFANGSEVDPPSISPKLRPVSTESEAALFRYASLLWSVPVSRGYGRRSRFLVMDEQNGKLIGIFALGDPVYNLSVRDRLIGWNVDQRNERLYNVLDAFVLGAVSPYRDLIAGKLVAMLATSEPTLAFIEAKYRDQATNIQQKVKKPRPVLLTTTSALGRSSLYNRLSYAGRPLFQSVGFTEGWGTFQFSEDLFSELCRFLSLDGGIPSYEFGGGPNWRMRTLRQGLEGIGLNSDLLRHGLRREVFLAPLARQWQEYLRGETDRPGWYRYKLGDLSSHYRDRWAIPRAERNPEFREFNRDSLKLVAGCE